MRTKLRSWNLAAVQCIANVQNFGTRAGEAYGSVLATLSYITRSFIGFPLYFALVVNLEVLVGSNAGITKDQVGGRYGAGDLTVALAFDVTQGVGTVAAGVGDCRMRADFAASRPTIVGAIDSNLAFLASDGK